MCASDMYLWTCTLAKSRRRIVEAEERNGGMEDELKISHVTY